MKSTVTKSVSLPKELAKRANMRVKSDPELDWSKYVRRLVREDLAKQPKLEIEEVAA